MKLIHTLLYFAIFKYPLKKEELFQFCQYKTNAIDEDLYDLITSKKVFCIDGFYLPSNKKEWVERRVKGNEMAKIAMKKAKRMAKILSQFPFVRSVMISGTLAKGYMDEDADIDFFVIMKPGNITISKLFMGLFRRIFAPKSFCVNYLIDTNHLEIKTKNLYAATEMITLIPVIDSGLYNTFMDSNMNWVLHYLPNAVLQKHQPDPIKNGTVKLMLEAILSTTLASRLNNSLQKRYLKKLGEGKKEFKKSLETGELDIDKGVFKGHNLAYQSTIHEIYEENKVAFAVDKAWEPKHFFYD